MPQTNISNEKLQANRENAKHSTGPRSEQGKRICSQNALKHGLLARQAVLPGEDIHEYDAHLRSLEERFQPAGFLEFSLLRQIVDAEWRLRRLTRIETALALHAVVQKRRSRARWPESFPASGELALYGPEADPDTLAELRETELFGDAMQGETARIIDIYGRHGARLLRQFERALSQFTQLQKTRAAQPQPEPHPQPGLVHRRPPQSASEYTPPPSDPALDDAPVTLAQSLDPLVRSRLRGDPELLDQKNAKQTQPHLTHTTETTYRQDALAPQPQPRVPTPDRDPPDS